MSSQNVADSMGDSFGTETASWIQHSTPAPDIFHFIDQSMRSVVQVAGRKFSNPRTQELVGSVLQNASL